MSLRSKKGFTLIELIIVIAILGIIALIAVPNLAGIRQRAQVSADKRTAEQIGKAVRIWATDIDAGARNIPTGNPVEYSTISGLCPAYISSGYTARSFTGGAGKYYVSSVGSGVNNAEQKIYVYIGASTAPSGKTPTAVAVGYDGSPTTSDVVSKNLAYAEK